MTCSEFKTWLVEKEFVDTEATVVARSHMHNCEDCRSLYKLDAELESIIRTYMLTDEPPAGLLRKIDAGIKLARMKKVFSFPWNIGPALAIAALVMLFMYPFHVKELTPGFHSMDQVSQVVLQDHLRHVPMSFVAEDVVDVEGWFAAVHNIAFTMPDLDQEGYSLVGGRKCELGQCDAVYLLYAKDGKRISVFILPESDIKFPMTEGQSYGVQIAQSRVKLWKGSGQVHAMVI
jgi:anti-sigma factor RsiW